MGRPGSVIREEMAQTYRDLQDLETRLSGAKAEIAEQDALLEHAIVAVDGHRAAFQAFRSQSVVNMTVYSDALDKLTNHETQLAQIRERVSTGKSAIAKVEKHRDNLLSKFQELNNEFDATGAQIIPFHGF